MNSAVNEFQKQGQPEASRGSPDRVYAVNALPPPIPEGGVPFTSGSYS